MHILKSLCLAVFLVVIIASSVFAVRKCIDAYTSYEPYVGKSILTGLWCLFALFSVIQSIDFLNPFDRILNFELYAAIDIPPENSLQGPDDWHSVYDIMGDTSFFFDPNNPPSHFGVEWPEMDFEHHTYIITYGQKLESLSYNVWNYVKFPFYTGVKIGQAQLNSEFNPNIIYIYEICRMRIDSGP